MSFKWRRGFGSMSPEKQREIASKGGRAAHEQGTAHEWTVEEAREAGRKGGLASHRGKGKSSSSIPKMIFPVADVQEDDDAPYIDPDQQLI